MKKKKYEKGSPTSFNKQYCLFKKAIAKCKYH